MTNLTQVGRDHERQAIVGANGGMRMAHTGSPTSEVTTVPTAEVKLLGATWPDREAAVAECQTWAFNQSKTLKTQRGGSAGGSKCVVLMCDQRLDNKGHERVGAQASTCCAQITLRANKDGTWRIVAKGRNRGEKAGGGITKPTELNHTGACGGYAKANGKIVQSCAQFTSLLAGNKRAGKTEMANALNLEGIKLPSSSMYRNREFAGKEDPEAYKTSFQYLDGYSDSFSETPFVNGTSGVAVADGQRFDGLTFFFRGSFEVAAASPHAVSFVDMAHSHHQTSTLRTFGIAGADANNHVDLFGWGPWHSGVH